jgi:steroid delta-isomerase-like uncharacterized protein
MAHHTKTTPSREELSRLNRAWVDAFESGDLSRIDELLAPDFVDHNPAPGTTPDREGVKSWVREIRQAFSNVRATTEDEIVEGDKVVVRARLSGRHTGPYQGMPATNKEFSIETIDIVRVRDGKAAEHWGVFDALGMLQQLGLVEAPGTPEMASAR